MDALKMRLMAAYGLDTCHPSYADKWSPENPTAGQCAITALLVHEMFGYDIYEIKVNRSRHFFNKTPKGEVVDLTAEQFTGKVIPYDACRKREPKELYRSCGERLTILKSKINEQE